MALTRSQIAYKQQRKKKAGALGSGGEIIPPDMPPDPPDPSNWILADGTWRDAGIWSDNEVWYDNNPNP